MKNWFIVVLGFFSPVLIYSQVSFEAYTNARQVVLNSYFDVTFTLRNADAERFEPPAMEDFQVLSGPARALSTTIVNGAVSKELSVSYTLRPKRKGKFIIGSARMTVNGKTLRTKPLIIEVVEAKNLGKNNPVNRVYVRAELNVSNAFLGQQITLDYKLYTAVDIESYSILKEGEYEGFYAQDLRRYDTPPTREVIKGVQYITKILKRVALFPQQAGKLVVQPLQLELAVLKEDPRDEGFFLNRPVQRLIVQTEPVSVSVRNLPHNAPAAFNGAVGTYSAGFILSSTEVSTDDVFSLRLSISGNGDIKRVQPPKLNLPDGFEIYDPKVLEETTLENLDGSVVGKKEIEYLIQPKLPGTYRLQPVFSYFDPEKQQYVTLNETVFNLTVQQGTQGADATATAKPTALVADDIRYLKTDTHLERASDQFFATPLFWTLTAFPLLFLIGAVFVKTNQNRRTEVDVSQTRIKRARQEALRRLKLAEQHLKANAGRAFYDEISKALLGYVCDKLQIAGSVLTKENVREQLQSLQVAAAHIEDFMQIIQTCEVALYSGKDHPAAMNDVYLKAVSNLSKMEESLK
jgi:hypothetical protein